MVLFDCMACAILAYPNGGRFWLKLVLQMLRSGCDEIAGAGGYSRVAGLGGELLNIQGSIEMNSRLGVKPRLLVPSQITTNTNFVYWPCHLQSPPFNPTIAVPSSAALSSGLLGVLGYASFFTWLWDCQLRAFPGD